MLFLNAKCKMQNAELWRIFSLKVENLHSIFGLDAL